VDLAAGTVAIWRQLAKVEQGHPVWKPRPKSASGVRVLHLPASALAALKRHRSLQDGERLRYGPRYADYGLVFATRLGHALQRVHVRRYWHRACARAGVDALSFHSGRHTAASSYIAAGVPLPEVSRILGHANPGITARIYSHALAGTAKEAADSLDRFLDDENGEDAAAR